MAGKGSTFAYEFARLVFNAQNRTGAWGSSGATGLYVRLHTADPAAGTGGTNEVGYSAYAPVLTTRTSATGGWNVSTPTSANVSIQPVSAITFPQNTSTSTGTITHFSLTTSTASADLIWYSGTVTPNINYSQNVTPILTTGSSITED